MLHLQLSGRSTGVSDLARESNREIGKDFLQSDCWSSSASIHCGGRRLFFLSSWSHLCCLNSAFGFSLQTSWRSFEAQRSRARLPYTAAVICDPPALTLIAGVRFSYSAVTRKSPDTKHTLSVYAHAAGDWRLLFTVCFWPFSVECFFSFLSLLQLVVWVLEDVYNISTCWNSGALKTWSLRYLIWWALYIHTYTQTHTQYIHWCILL